MEHQPARTYRKSGVILNYLCLFLFVALFYSTEHITGWNSIVIICTLLLLVMTVITFIKVYVKSGLWKLIHSKIEKLDDREIYVTHEALRYAYAIISVVLLIIIFVMALTSMGKDALGPVLPASLIYFAHTLPSAVIVWKDKELLINA